MLFLNSILLAKVDFKEFRSSKGGISKKTITCGKHRSRWLFSYKKGTISRNNWLNKLRKTATLYMTNIKLKVHTVHMNMQQNTAKWKRSSLRSEEEK